LIKDKLFPLTAKILGCVAKSYSVAVEAKGSTQEHRTCGKVQFVDGEMCADEDLPPALSVKVEEANFLKGKLQQQVYIINPRESSDVQALVQKQIFVPVDLSLRSPFSDLAMAKSRRGDAGQSEILPENDIRKKAINESAVSDQGIDSIQGRGIAEQPHPRSDSNNRRAKSRRPTAHEDPVALERRKAVDAYIKEVLEKTGKRITRADIWKSARYKSRTEFERWQRNDPKATKSANERFTRLLKEKPHLK